MFLSPRSRFSRYVLPVLFLGVALFFFLIPGVRLVLDLQDPALRSAGIPQAAWRLHHRLAEPYATWARDRLDSAQGSKVDSDNVSGTEWPLFGSVFYLWSMEALQTSWQAHPEQAAVAPVVEARAAIENAANLVVDPNQGAWVREKWGANYLHRQNLFYRFLLISAMTSYTHLTGNPRLLDQLRDEVETLGAELDASRVGLLEDYPGECYPTDVVGAITAIHRADAVLKTDHSAFVQRALRAFQPPHVDADGLPPYFTDVWSGKPLRGSRGCGNSFEVICAPEIWPATASLWYEAYVTHFWQARNGLVGFREFSSRVPRTETFMDVDSGPVIWGFGFAASAFGTGAARVNGRRSPLSVATNGALPSRCRVIVRESRSSGSGRRMRYSPSTGKNGDT